MGTFCVHSQTRKVLQLKKNGELIYSIPLKQVKELRVADGWNYFSERGKSLFQEMSQRPELSRFVQILRIAGYEYALDMPDPNPDKPSFYYSVVAPTNTVLENLTQEDLQDSVAMRKLVRCYISRSKIADVQQVSFLNKMQIENTFVNPVLCHNGSLYITSKAIPGPVYMSDLLLDYSELSWFRNAISPCEILDHGSEIVLEEDQYSNVQLNFAGIGNQSTALVPVNSVYDNFMTANGCYFDSQDTLTRKYKPAPWAGNPLVRLMTVEGRYSSYEEMPDLLTIQSTGRKIAKEQLKLGEPIVTDGAAVFPLYELPYTFDDIYSTIITEGENTYRLYSVGNNMVARYCTLNTDTLSLSPLSSEYISGQKYTVSGGKYVYVQQATSQSSIVRYGVSNTLAGAYDVWVSFIPGSMVEGVVPKPSSVNGNIRYCIVNNQKLQINTQKITDFTIDPYAVTRIKVAENLNLGVCFDGFLKESEYLYTADGYVQYDLLAQKYGFWIMLKNSTDISDKESDHNLYIDCIELVPHKVK